MKKTLFGLSAVVFLAIFTSDSDADQLKWRIRKGENLTRIAERYNLATSVILEANKDNRCVKNKNLILAGCKIIIPVEQIPQVVAVHEAHAKAVEQTVVKMTAAASGIEEKIALRNAYISMLIVLMIVTVVLTLGMYHIKKLVWTTELENTRDMLNVAETTMKHQKMKLEVQGQQLAAKSEVEQEAERLRDLLKKAYDDLEAERSKKLPDGVVELTEEYIPKEGDEISLKTRDNGTIKVRVLRAVVNVACPVSEDCLANKNKDLTVQKAVRHIYTAHSTSQEHNPDGMTE